MLCVRAREGDGNLEAVDGQWSCGLRGTLRLTQQEGMPRLGRRELPLEWKVEVGRPEQPAACPHLTDRTRWLRQP